MRRDGVGKGMGGGLILKNLTAKKMDVWRSWMEADFKAAKSVTAAFFAVMIRTRPPVQFCGEHVGRSGILAQEIVDRPRGYGQLGRFCSLFHGIPATHGLRLSKAP